MFLHDLLSVVSRSQEVHIIQEDYDFHGELVRTTDYWGTLYDFLRHDHSEYRVYSIEPMSEQAFEDYLLIELF